MKTTHRLWCVLFGLLNSLLASADWMLHTPGGGPMDKRCPCLARELCPRVFGLSYEDFRYFGQLPVCPDSRQVRCCGASLRVEVGESQTPSATVEGDVPQNATDGEIQVITNKKNELPSNDRDHLPSGEFVSDVETNRDVKETTKFSGELKQLHNKPDVDIPTSDYLNVDLTRRHKLEETYSGELESEDDDALTSDKELEMSKSNSERHKRKNLDDARKPRTFPNDNDKPQHLRDNIDKSMESNESNSNIGQKDNSIKRQKYTVFSQLLNSIQESLKDATEKFNKLQKTLLNFMIGTENQSILTETGAALTPSKSENNNIVVLEKTIDDKITYPDLTSGRFDRSMYGDGIVTFPNPQIETQENIDNMDDQENNESMADGNRDLTEFPFLDTDSQLATPNITNTENNNYHNIEYGDKLQNTNDDITDELDTVEMETEMSEDYNLAEGNKEHVSHHFDESGDTLDESNTINKHISQSNDTDVLSYGNSTHRSNAEGTISIEDNGGSKDALEEGDDNLETSESIHDVRTPHNIAESSGKHDGIQNIFEIDPVGDDIFIEAASLQPSININTERIALDIEEARVIGEESETTEARLDLMTANNDNEGVRGVDQLKAKNNLNENKSKNSEVVDEIEVSTTHVSLDYVNETSDDPHEMRNIDVTIAQTNDVVDNINDAQTFRDVTTLQDIDETITDVPFHETNLKENKTTEIAKEDNVDVSIEHETFADTADTPHDYEVMQKEIEKFNDTRAEINVHEDVNKIGGDDLQNTQDSSTVLPVKEINEEFGNTPVDEAEDVTEIFQERGNSSETQDTKGGSGDSNKDENNMSDGSLEEAEDEGDVMSSEEDSDESIEEDQEDESKVSSEEESDKSSEEDQNGSKVSSEESEESDESSEEDQKDESKVSSEESEDESDEMSEIENESNESNKKENRISRTNTTENTFQVLSDADQAADEDSNVERNGTAVVIKHNIESSRAPGSRSLHDRNSVHSEDNLELESKIELSIESQAQILGRSDFDPNSPHAQLNKSVTNLTTVSGIMYVFPSVMESRKEKSRTPFIVYPNNFSLKEYIMRGRKEETSIDNDKALNITQTNCTEKHNATNEAESAIARSSSAALHKTPLTNVTTHSGFHRIKIKKLIKRTRKNNNRKNLHESTNTNMTLPSTNIHSASDENFQHFNETNTRTDKVDNIKYQVEEIKTLSNTTIPVNANESINAVKPSFVDVQTANNVSGINETHVEDTYVSASENLPRVLLLEEIKAFHETFGRRENVSAPEKQQITKDESDVLNNPIENVTTTKSPFFRRNLRPSIPKSQPRETTTPISLPKVYIKNREQLQRRSKPAIGNRNRTESLMVSTTKQNITEENISLNGTKRIYSTQNATGIFRSFKMRNSTLSPPSYNSRIKSRLVPKVSPTNITTSTTSPTASENMTTIAPVPARNHSRFKLPPVIIKKTNLERPHARSQNDSTTSFKRETMHQNGSQSILKTVSRNGSMLSFQNTSETPTSRNASKYFDETSLPKQLDNMSVGVKVETKLNLDAQTASRNFSGEIYFQAPLVQFREMGLATPKENNSRTQIRNETVADLIPSRGELSKNHGAHHLLKEDRRLNPPVREHQTVKPNNTVAVVNDTQNITNNESHQALFLSKRLNSLSRGKPTSNNVVPTSGSKTLQGIGANVTEPTKVKTEENTNETRQLRGKIRFQPPCQSSTTNSNRPVRCSTPAIKELISEISHSSNASSPGLENAKDVVIRKFFPSRLGSKAVEIRLKNNTENTEINVTPQNVNDSREIIKDTTSHGNQPPCQNLNTHSKRPVRCSTPAIKELIAEITKVKDKIENVTLELMDSKDVMTKLFPSKLGSIPMDTALKMKNNPENTGINVPPRLFNNRRKVTKDTTAHTSQAIDQTNEPTLEYGHRIMKINPRPHVSMGKMNAPQIILPDEDNVMKIILPTPTEENFPEKLHESQKLFTIPSMVQDGFVPPINLGRSGPVSIIGPVPKGYIDRAIVNPTNRAPLAFSLPVNLKVSPFRSLTQETSPHLQFNAQRVNTSPKVSVNNTPTFQPIKNVEQMKEQHNMFLRQQVETLYRGKKRKETQQVTNRHNEEQIQFQDEIRPELKLAYNEEYLKQQQEMQWKQGPKHQKQDEQKPQQRLENFQQEKQKLFGSQQNKKFIESRLTGRHRTQLRH